jgi:hypothetical protein
VDINSTVLHYLDGVVLGIHIHFQVFSPDAPCCRPIDEEVQDNVKSWEYGV